VGEGGYQVGGFPHPWSEWNGKYRDSIRRFWAGFDQHVKDIGYRVTGSSDVFVGSGRRPHASVNFVTSHDGFTLHDLVTYEQKHNEANGEENRDGDNHNNARNFGVEGETSDPAIVTLRRKQVRNLLATMFLSQGVPMLLGGDEMGRTQRGNNNAYCQDNEISWFDWELDDERRALLDFTKRLIALRKKHPVLRRRRFFQGVHVRGSELKDLAWFRPDGVEMTGKDWESPRRAIAYLLGGDATLVLDDEGAPVVDDSLLVLINAAETKETFVLPALEWGSDWERVLDTAAAGAGRAEHSGAGARISVDALSLVVLVNRHAP
jgi:glycogen operon protein